MDDVAKQESRFRRRLQDAVAAAMDAWVAGNMVDPEIGIDESPIVRVWREWAAEAAPIPGIDGYGSNGRFTAPARIEAVRIIADQIYLFYARYRFERTGDDVCCVQSLTMTLDGSGHAMWLT